MIEAKLAPVRPRVTTSDETDAVLLEEEVRTRLGVDPRGLIVLSGPAGSGKTTALSHLAEVFHSDARLCLYDDRHLRELGPNSLSLAASKWLVVCDSSAATRFGQDCTVWHLARWGTDEFIEYLLSAQREACGSVMRRVPMDSGRHELVGLPELWRVVLDRFAGDESIQETKTALRLEIDALLTDEVVRSAVGLWSFVLTCHPERDDELMDALHRLEGIKRSAIALLRHSQVRLLSAAEYAADELRSSRLVSVLKEQVPEPLVQETATIVKDDPKVVRRLDSVLSGSATGWQPMAASLRLAMNGRWRPAYGRTPNLAQAHLAGAQWPGIEFEQLDATDADLAGADLTEARLDGVIANGANLVGACLHGAQLKSLSARRARMIKVDLSFARAPAAILVDADLRGANLEGALLNGANISNANLSGAHCRRADFSDALFHAATLSAADFTGANLLQANLDGVKMSDAIFFGAQFSHASLDHCDLELLRLPGANFEKASLRGATLTGTQMPGACFRKADLFGARLGQVEWERVDLGGADLRDCTFHFGSSRSGLVGSPIACEGSRTGFYTDEYLEQDFKSPEDIRKANLRGADLRGAQIDGVDFYLVDLRDARYTPAQEQLLRACNAILETRV